MKTFVFCPHSRIPSIELFVPTQNLFMPARQSRYSGAGPGLHQNYIVFFEVSVSGLGLSELGPILCQKRKTDQSLPRRQHWLHELGRQIDSV